MPESLAIFEARQRTGILDSAVALHNPAKAHQKLEEYKESIACLERQLPIMEKFHAPGEYPKKIKTLLTIAKLHTNLSDYAQALNYQKKVLNTFSKKFVRQTLCSRPSFGKYRQSPLSVKPDRKAKNCLRKALKVFENHHGHHHPITIYLLEMLSHVCHTLGKKRQADGYRERSNQTKTNSPSLLLDKPPKDSQSSDPYASYMIKESYRIYRYSLYNFLDIEMASYTVPQLLALAVRLAGCIYPYLETSWQNPAVASLCAFLIIADKLKIIAHFAKFNDQIEAFIKEIKLVSHQAIILLQENGNQASIESIINGLFEYGEGYKGKQALTSEESQNVDSRLSQMPSLDQLFAAGSSPSRQLAHILTIKG